MTTDILPLSIREVKPASLVSVMMVCRMASILAVLTYGKVKCTSHLTGDLMLTPSATSLPRKRSA
jgi:hypothetical protein